MATAEPPPVPSADVPILPASVASVAPARTVAPAAVDAGGTSTLSQERALMQGARMAIVRGQPAGALPLLDEHEQRFPKGQLSEEREALRIEALARMGRKDEARARAARFRRAHPQSLFLPVLDDLLIP
jgi:hypothetical protein